MLYSVFNEHLLFFKGAVTLVGLDGLEPSTSRLSGARSSHLSYRPFYSKAYSVQSTVLSCGFRSRFLSSVHFIGEEWDSNLFLKLTLERLVSVNHQLQQFSLYGARAVNRKLVEMMGFEPMTPCLQGRCSPN